MGYKWARKGSNLRPMDYESHHRVVSAVVKICYNAILGQKRGLQVNDKSLRTQ